MTRFVTLALLLTTLIACGPKVILHAQTTKPASQSASMSVAISLQKDKYAIDEKPVAVLTVKNVSNHVVS